MTKRGWNAFAIRDHLMRMLGICNLIPGPNSTEMAIHIGQQQAGIPGLIGLAMVPWR
jgi:chromate transporter